MRKWLLVVALCGCGLAAPGVALADGAFDGQYDGKIFHGQVPGQTGEVVSLEIRNGAIDTTSGNTAMNFVDDCGKIWGQGSRDFKTWSGYDPHGQLDGNSFAIVNDHWVESRTPRTHHTTTLRFTITDNGNGTKTATGTVSDEMWWYAEEVARHGPHAGQHRNVRWDCKSGPLTFTAPDIGLGPSSS